jgi:subtilase family serine protease
MLARSVTAALLSLLLGAMLQLAVAPVAAAASPSLPPSTAAPGSAAAPTVVQASSPVATPANEVEATVPTSTIEFDVGLQPSDPAGAQALERAVSDPSSPSYGHFLTAAEWERRFSPSAATVKTVTAWLEAEGISVQGASPDRLTLQASAPAASVEKAFGTSLKQYRHLRRIVRLSAEPLKVPAAIAPLISGVTGVDQSLATPDRLTGVAKRSSEKLAPAKAPGKEIPQPPGFRNAPPCSSFYGKKSDTSDPPYGGGYPNPLPYAVCGYVPEQLQGAYGLSSSIAAGIDGRGVTVAIVDAYASPTLLADARRYSELNQPTQVLRGGQFSESLSKTFNQVEACEASEWYGEQTLDVEAVHATSPGAKILYVGAKNCEAGLYKSVQEIVDGHLADVITNSWGENGGDLLESAGSRHAFDNILLMAAGTGIGVQFSAGDEGDEFANLGMTVADYPPSSPYATAVGGTSLQVGKANTRIGELGWSTSESVLCSTLLQSERYPGCKSAAKLDTWAPPAPGEYLYGGGGGTSYQYAEPWYQEGVVPADLAARNSSITGIANRVEPDISMDADPATGMLVGETQEFPDGTYYDQYRIGGTSLSSPLFAGEMADADQAAGAPLGFVNPLLYALGASAAQSAFYDVVPAALQAQVRNDYLDGVDAKEGTLTSVRTLEYEGREVYCSGTGNCTRQKVALSTAPGFDSMTGLGSPGSALIAALAKP